MSSEAGDDDDVPLPSPPAAETVLTQNTYNKNHLSVVSILLRGGKQGVPHGTGFVVHNDGTSCLILTCDHVVERIRQGNLQLRIKFETMDDEVPAQVMHSTEASDLALLYVPAGAVPKCSPLEFSDETDLSGRDVVLLGYFGVDDRTLLTTPASPHGKIMSEPVRASQDLEGIVCSYTSESGMSGGPVIMDEDKVVGVHFKCELGMSLAVTSGTVKSVLKGWLGRGNESPDVPIKEMLQLIADGAYAYCRIATHQ